MIYKITNLINQKIYIGKTTRGLDVRMNEHINRADKNHCMLISRAIAKYGEKHFKIEELDRNIDKSKLNELEKYWINFYNSNNIAHGYNLTTGGDGGDIIGSLPNKLEIYERRADSNRGKVRSEECRQRISDASPNRGKKMSCEQKEKLRQHNLGKVHSEETKKKISISCLGRKTSEVTKAKISKATLGKPHPKTRKHIIIDNIVYDSLTEASEKLNIITSVIHYRLNTTSKKFNNYKYL